MTRDELDRDAVGSWRAAIEAIRARMVEECGDPPLSLAEVWPNHPKRKGKK